MLNRSKGGKGKGKSRKGGSDELERDGKVRVVRIIMNLITSNTFMKEVVGDVDLADVDGVGVGAGWSLRVVNISLTRSLE